MDFDTSVKLAIYETFARTGKAPTAEDIAQQKGASAQEVLAAFARLHAKRLLVPEPGHPDQIRMAPPFSGVETPFLVKANDLTYFANCIWDAFGIAAALQIDAIIETKDGSDGTAITLAIKDGAPVKQDCKIHFAVPAAKWWDDIIYT